MNEKSPLKAKEASHQKNKEQHKHLHHGENDLHQLSPPKSSEQHAKEKNQMAEKFKQIQI